MTATKAKFAPTGTGLYPTFVALMAVVLILSNIGASKPVTFGSIVTDGGFFLFPLAYIIGDVVSEVYGWKASRRAVSPDASANRYGRVFDQLGAHRASSKISANTSSGTGAESKSRTV